MRDQDKDREERKFAAVVTAAAAGLALAVYSAVTTMQPHADREAATLPAAATIAAVPAAPAFAMQGAVAATADGAVFEYF
jgi:hypothetical protein